MAAEARNQADDLERRLLAEPQNFSLSQMVRLLSVISADTPEGIDSFLRRNIRIVPWLSLAFPTSDVVSAERAEEDGRTTYTVTSPSFGLYSTMGSLPTFYTEELLDEARDDESISRDFLDIINNHLFHLLYAARRHGSLERRTVENPPGGAELVQFSLMGQAEELLRDPGLPALAVADLFARRSRSAVRLERYLAFVLERDGVCAAVEVEQCVERRAPLPRAQLCRVGLGNCTLGEDAVVGSEIADSTGKFRIHLRGVAPSNTGKFLPGRPGYASFRERAARYLDTPQEYDLVLHPSEERPEPARLGEGARLGFYLGAEAAQPVTVSWKER